MKAKIFSMIFVIGIILMSIITIVSADGGFFPSAEPAAYEAEKDITLPAQKAVIIYENNTEDLILQVKYEGEVEKKEKIEKLRYTLKLSFQENREYIRDTD